MVIDNNILSDAPFLTVGIANYNYGRYLSRGFEAIRKQKFRDIELIYVDNNSSDDSRDIIQKLMERADFPVKLVIGENIGICGNRNRILEYAKGKYIMICDADDWITDDCLEVLCKKAIETNADQIVGEYQKVDNNGKILYRHFFPDSAVKWSNWGYHGSIYKRSVIEENNIRFNPDWKGDDACFCALFHKYSKETIFVPQIVDNWYKHNHSITSMYSEEAKSKETSFNGSSAFEKTTSFIHEIYQEIPKKDQEQLEYMWSLMYYYNIVYHRPALKFEDDFREYCRNHQIMVHFFPEYLHNKALKSPCGRGFYRKKVAIPAFILAFLERICFIKIALLCYWGLTHIYKLKY